MQLLNALLLLSTLGARFAEAVYRDEVDHIDFHLALLGLPQPSTTFFLKPRPGDQASLLYTLSDLGVLGAINPNTAAVLWRQALWGRNETLPNRADDDVDQVDRGISRRTSFLIPAGDGSEWLYAANEGSIHAWNALTGRNLWWMDFGDAILDLETFQLPVTHPHRQDVLVLSKNQGEGSVGGTFFAKRLDGISGRVLWEFRGDRESLPVRICSDKTNVYLVTLHPSALSYGIKIVVLDSETGKMVEEATVSTRFAESIVKIHDRVMVIKTNSAAPPILVWTDGSPAILSVKLLGSKEKYEFRLTGDTISVDIHALRFGPALERSQFLVHSRTTGGHRAAVFDADTETGRVTKVYDLPYLPGPGGFSACSDGSNTFFSHITEEEVVLTSGSSPNEIMRWPLDVSTSASDMVLVPIHAASEVLRKSDGSLAVRTAVTTTDDDWVMIRGGEIDWVRREGLTDAVAAAWAEIPYQGEDLVEKLEREVDPKSFKAFLHRVRRKVNHALQLLEHPVSLSSLILHSLGVDLSTWGFDGSSAEGVAYPARDAFGLNKIIVLATRRGRLYGLELGKAGRVIWSIAAAHQTTIGDRSAKRVSIKGVWVNDTDGTATVLGSRGETTVVRVDSGEILSSSLATSPTPIVHTAAVVDSAEGEYLLAVGAGGSVRVPAGRNAPRQTVVVRTDDRQVRGLIFLQEARSRNVNEPEAPTVAWTFALPQGQTIAVVATRPSHDPTASIGNVLANRSVRYKYLNPNSIVIAASDAARSTLTTYLVDTVSGQVLGSATHMGVDVSKHIACVLSENWFACSFFAAYTLADDTNRSVAGYHISVSDLFESSYADDRGPLGDSPTASSLQPLDSALVDAPPLPVIVSQTYVTSAPISIMAVTQTRQGITTRQLLAYLSETRAIAAVPRPVLDPRRPVGRDPSAAELEVESLMRYVPALELDDPRALLTHQREVLGIRQLMTAPALVESTSLVFACGLDVFGTRTTPSQPFDILGKGFNKLSVVLTVGALFLAVGILRPMVRRRQIDLIWQAQL